jgi:molybdopterin converting factor small subunit
MSVVVQLTYDMSKEIGSDHIEVEGATTVKDVIDLTRERFTAGSESFDTLARVAAVALNGVLVNYRMGFKTRVSDGDRVAFVKAAAGG